MFNVNGCFACNGFLPVSGADGSYLEKRTRELSTVITCESWFSFQGVVIGERVAAGALEPSFCFFFVGRSGGWREYCS
jgi:hypothetical protein